jgi:hypothetical protein
MLVDLVQQQKYLYHIPSWLPDGYTHTYRTEPILYKPIATCPCNASSLRLFLCVIVERERESLLVATQIPS